MIERSERVGGACVSEVADCERPVPALCARRVGARTDAGLRLPRDGARGLRGDVRARPRQTRVLPDASASAWIHRDPAELERELANRWGERGDVAGFRADEARVVAYLQDGYRRAIPPSLPEAELALGPELVRLWITGAAADLLDHYFTAERAKVYMGMTVTESGPVSLREPYSAFTVPLMDSGRSSTAIMVSCEMASGA
jgi:hypothetical protein